MAIYLRINCPIFRAILDKFGSIYPEIYPNFYLVFSHSKCGLHNSGMYFPSAFGITFMVLQLCPNSIELTLKPLIAADVGPQFHQVP